MSRWPDLARRRAAEAAALGHAGDVVPGQARSRAVSNLTTAVPEMPASGCVRPDMGGEDDSQITEPIEFVMIPPRRGVVASCPARPGHELARHFGVRRHAVGCRRWMSIKDGVYWRCSTRIAARGHAL